MINQIKEYFRRRKQINNTIYELQSLSDQELNDIGISRGMIYEVAQGK